MPKLNFRRLLPAPLKSLLRPLYYSLASNYYSLAGRQSHTRGADKRRVAIICPTFLPGADAVSNDALGMYETIVGEGLQVDIYAATPQPNVGLTASTISARLAGYGLVIHHYTAYIPQLAGILKWPANVVLKYHNITPGHFFENYSAEYSKECDKARSDLPNLLRVLPSVKALADSEFNRRELLAMGMQETSATVVRPFHQIDKLLQLRPPSTRAGSDILAVGRVVPNKGLDMMIHAFAQVAKGNHSTRLHIVGTLDDRLSLYHRYLRDLVGKYQLDGRVIFHGSVSQHLLAEFYAASACLWTCSQHEGFCVPVVEAMAFGMPIVSTSTTALPDTCGDAAIYGSTRDELAEALCTFLSKPELRERLGRRARKRYETEFAIERITQRFKSAITPFLPVSGR